jgi:hypothetical protein
MGRFAGVAIVMLAGVACGQGAPQPPLFPTAATAASPNQPWRLTTAVTAVTGPDNCVAQGFRAVAGQPLYWLLGVTRGDQTVAFDYDVRNHPTDDVQEHGSLEGQALTAASDGAPYTRQCPHGTPLQGTFVANVAGRFSDDGAHLTAEETWSYQLTTGNIDVHITWSADR